MATSYYELLEKAEKLPWEYRLLNANWNIRFDANIDVYRLCITNQIGTFHEFQHFFKKTVTDPSDPVQFKALDALIAYLQAVHANVAARYAKEICDAVAANCLYGHPKTVEKAKEVFLLWVELGAADVFLDAMEIAIKSRVAKAVPPAVDAMSQALSEFGSKIVPPERILKMLPELFAHQDQFVHSSSKRLILELCRWIGRDPVMSILNEKMSDTIKKELEAELANVTMAAEPTCKIRSDQVKESEQEVATDATGSGPSEESATEIPPEVDEYELVDPEDVEPAEMTLEEIESRLGSPITITHLKSAAWEKRIEGISETVADIESHALAMKCLTTFCEVVGPGFIFERMSKIIKEHELKNPKVLNGALLWMASAVEDYGVTHLKVKDVTDFITDTGLWSSDTATKNASIKLLGALHEYVDPDIEMFAHICAVRNDNEKKATAAALKKNVEASDLASFISERTKPISKMDADPECPNWNFDERAEPISKMDVDPECPNWNFDESSQLQKLSLSDPQDQKRKMNLAGEGTKSNGFQAFSPGASSGEDGTDILTDYHHSLLSDESIKQEWREQLRAMDDHRALQALLKDACTRCGLSGCCCGPDLDESVLKRMCGPTLKIPTKLAKLDDAFFDKGEKRESLHPCHYAEKDTFRYPWETLYEL